MKKTKTRKLAIAVTAIATVVVAGCIGCSPTTQQASDATQQQDTTVVKKSLGEWVSTYPLEGDSYMQSRMAHTYEAFAGACTMAFGAEDAPVACASCHARDDFNAEYAEKGESILADNASNHQMEWSNCTNCHVGDPGEGVVKGGNAYGDATSASAKDLFPESDYVCGQCHAMFPGTAYMEDANKGIDQYKYGYDPDGMLKAMKEYWSQNNVTSTDIAAGMVGVPYYDSEIDTVLYLTDACTAVEMFQNSTHQNMGLTCTDCHMPKATSSDGTEYTSHNMTVSPLENPDAIEKCLTCHKAQGIDGADAMVSFVKGKMADLGARQEQTKQKLASFHDALAAAVASSSKDQATLDAAKDAYNTANVYYLFQLATTDEGEKTAGEMAAMNGAECNELLDKANALIDDAMASLA